MRIQAQLPPFKFSNMKKVVLLLVAAVLALSSANAKKKALPDWREGYLDIHQISTGRGSAALYILPDGTRMVVDMGDLGDPSRWKHKEIMPAVPSDEKRPAEWVARYIEHFSKPINKPLYVDYALITHFHNDHMGHDDHLAIEVADKPYKYTGITHLANLVPIHTLIDRGYPDYDYPSTKIMKSREKGVIRFYKSLVEERKAKGEKIEQFKVGADNQIVLRNRPTDYPTFRILNLCGNGKIWSGKGNEAVDAVPSSAPEGAYLNENSSSCGFRLEYGDFAYYTGGDIAGRYSKKRNNFWNDMQTPVSKIVGNVDVALADHHGQTDSMNGALLRALDAQAIVLAVWDLYHPQPKTMQRIWDILPDCEVYAAGMTPENRHERLGEEGKRIKKDGHIVVRVYEGGKKFQIFVLNDRSLDYEIIYKSRVFKARGNRK